MTILVTRRGLRGAAADAARLFERFATGRGRGGTGLGLFIVRELARAQGGDAFYDPPSRRVRGPVRVRLPVRRHLCAGLRCLPGRTS